MISVLHVDDEPTLLTISRLFIERDAECRVTPCESVASALALLEKEKFDIIVSDYEMPGMNGIDFLKKVRSHSVYTPFIIFTGRGREEVVIEALNSGADYYLQKGGDPKSQYAELIHKIHQAVGRCRMERELKDSRQLQTDIISFLPDGMFAVDLKGRVIAWNKAMEEMTGLSAEDVIGKGDYIYSVPFYEEKRPVLIDLVLNWDEGTAKKYTSIRRVADKIVAEIFISHIYGGKGAFFWVVASALYDSHGEVIGAIESLRNISDRIQTEITLAETIQQYSSIIDEQDEIIHKVFPDKTIGDDGRVSDTNPARFRSIFDYFSVSYQSLDEMWRIIDTNEPWCLLLGYGHDEIIGKSFEEILSPETRHLFSALFAEFMETGTILNKEIHLVRKNGDQFVALLTGRVQRETVTGRFIRAHCILHDITDQKQLEWEMEFHSKEMEHVADALTEANKKLNILSSVTRHDILNKLTILTGYMEIEKDLTTDPLLLSYIGKQSEAAQAIRNQIQFTKFYQDIGVQAPEWFNIERIVSEEAVNLPIHGISLTVSLSGIIVIADPLISKVFYNLMENSTRHGVSVTAIRIFAKESQGQLTIFYEDNGVGIPVSDKELIFQRGFGKNTGLGLFLVREILAITGITVMETGTEGEGVRFELGVPKEKYRLAVSPAGKKNGNNAIEP
ncbi:MAG: PAS domain S-box protein [Methanomicrobiales archaeon]